MIRVPRVCGVAALGLVLAACKFPELPPLEEIDAANGGDGGGIDAATDATICEGDRYGFTISNIAPCDVPPATVALDLSNVIQIDTFAGTMMSGGGSTAALPGTALVQQINGPQIRVVSVTSLLVPGTVTIEVGGEYPLAFLVRGDATVSGTLDAAGGDGALQPPGNRMTCGTGNGSAGTGAPQGGGGGGGALGSAGGAGGYGGGTMTTAGSAGVPLASPAISPLWGGCSGSAGSGGALPGAGGGAIQISAMDTLTINGIVTAGGGGGNGGLLASGGGGGGGSGGMIVLEAATIAGNGSVTANGGGGGGGGGGNSGANAGAGAAGCYQCAGPAAGGDSSGGGSGYGGNGAGGTTAATAGTSSGTASGGGGGGGVGLLWIRTASMTFTGIASPPPRTPSL